MTVRDWVHVLAKRLGITEAQLLHAFIGKDLSLSQQQLMKLIQLDPREPGALTEQQADLIVA